MRAYIITIGDELLSGQTVNTNSSYIGRKLEESNIKTLKIATISDDKEAILSELRSAFDQADIIITTGGLGPTHDDITLRTINEFFNSQLEINEVVLEDIREIFKNRNRDLTEINKNQALVPNIAKPIRNKKGTAPGIFIEKENKLFFAMPGVPHEMETMIDEFILQKLSAQNTEENSIKKSSNLLTTGIPESYLYEKLGDLDEILKGGKLAFLPNQFGVKMRISVEGETSESANDKIIEIEQQIRAKVGRNIYSKEESLENVVARLLIDRDLNIAVAESCTGGLISNRLTNVPGSSAYFERAFITYSNGAKVEHLRVDEDLVLKYGAVSMEVARLMADGVRAVSGTDLGLAVTGIMGPVAPDTNKPVGLVYIGICDDKICTAKEFRFGNDRQLNKDRTSQAALELLRRHLLGISYDE